MSGRCRDIECAPGSGCPECDPVGYALKKRREAEGPRCPHCDGLLSKGSTTLFENTRLHAHCFEEWKRTALPHTCPQCNGVGHTVTKWSETKACCQGGEPKYGGFGPFAGCEYCPNIRTIKEPMSTLTCELCKGAGRLKEKPIPVTETKVIGWKRG